MNSNEMISREMIQYCKQKVPVERVLALVDLINECRKNNVEIDEVLFFQNGFCVIFKGMPGDAILHDHSYGRYQCEWETIGMPWDCDDVSVHDSETLARLIGEELKKGGKYSV